MHQRKKQAHARPDHVASHAHAPPASPVKRPRVAEASIMSLFFSLFFCILIPRFLAANRVPVSDCDETFNFWEAVHHLTHRGGQQTWEQAPQFALRSWLYAGLHAVLFKIVSTCVPWISSPASFWFLSRFALAAMSSGVEAFAAAVILRECRKMKRMTCGYLAVAFLATSPGMFSHQVSLLPTTTAATLLLLSTALIIFDDAKYFPLVPLLAGIAILLGWPFACVAYAPVLLSTVNYYYHHELGLKRLFYHASYAACLVMTASVTCDTVMYAARVRSPCTQSPLTRPLHVWPFHILSRQPRVLQRLWR